MELYRKIRNPQYQYSDDVDWTMDLNTKELMNLLLVDKQIRNSFKQWLDNQG